MAAGQASPVEDTYRIFGEAFAVRSNSPDVLAYVRSVYRWFHVPAETPDGALLRTRARVILEVEDRLDSAGELLVRDANGSYALPCKDIHTLDTGGEHPAEDGRPHPLAYVDASFLHSVAQLVTDHDFIHAAAVSVQGGAVVLAGPSGRGKTTICLKLLREGFSLLSDEVACVRRDAGTVQPFPRLMKFDEQSRRTLGIPAARLVKARYTDRGETPWLLDVGNADPSAVGTPAPLRCIVLLEGFGVRTRLQPVSRAQALLNLTSLILRRPADVPAAVFDSARYVGSVPSYSLAIGDLDEAAQAIRALLDGSPGPTR